MAKKMHSILRVLVLPVIAIVLLVALVAVCAAPEPVKKQRRKKHIVIVTVKGKDIEKAPPIL